MSRPIIVLAALFAAAPAFATPPAAPQVTVGANQIKQLRFDWQILPRSNYYELWFKANDGAPEVKFGESVPWRPVALTSVSAHLLDWDQVRYRVKACNPSGCGSSPLIPVKSVLPDTIGFLKSPIAQDYASFGAIVDVSEDGQTLIAGSSDSDDPDAGPPVELAYVYRRHNGEWRFDARFAPSGNGEEIFASLALSADGSRFVAGFPDTRAGNDHVVIWHRTASGWVLEASIFPRLDRQGSLGEFVDSNAAGDLAVLGRDFASGTIDIYRRTGNVWNFVQTIESAGSGGCAGAGLSGDGQVVARACGERIEVFAAPDWTRRNLIAGAPGSSFGKLAIDATGNTIAAASVEQDSATSTRQRRVAIFHRGGTVYERQATLMAGPWFNQAAGSAFGSALALARDGGLVAINDMTDDAVGSGVFKPPLTPGPTVRGAVYVFEQHGYSWRLRRVVKPEAKAKFSAATWTFGRSLSLGDNGRTLVVGQPNESTLVPTTAKPQPQTGASSGAVWIY